MPMPMPYGMPMAPPAYAVHQQPLNPYSLMDGKLYIGTNFCDTKYLKNSRTFDTDKTRFSAIPFTTYDTTELVYFKPLLGCYS